MKNKLYLPSLCLFVILFFGCETAPKKAPLKGEQKKTITIPSIEKKSDAPFSRFQNEIDNFIQQDKDNSFFKNGIMMTGSSSIRMWTSMEEDFSAFPVLNRGFGGATIPEVLHFAGRYIFQHEPQIIVFYCGENDISEGASLETPPAKKRIVAVEGSSSSNISSSGGGDGSGAGSSAVAAASRKTTSGD